MLRLTNKSRKDLDQIAQTISDAFYGQKNTFSVYLTQEECLHYFRALVFYYYRNRCLYSYSEKGEGYMAYFQESKGPGRFSRFILFCRWICHIPFATLSKTGSSPEGWIYYKDLFRKEGDFIDVGLIAVAAPYQGKGIFREMMKVPVTLSKKTQLPCVLETDTKENARKYEAVGFHSVADMPYEEGLHLHAMRYEEG